MPFIRCDPSTLEEAGLPPSEGFEYESNEVTFDLDKLEKCDRLVLEALRKLGATHFRVRYDGGYDEGFAYPESLKFVAGERTADEVISDLVKQLPLIQQFRETGIVQRQNYFEKLANDLVIKYAFDNFAMALSIRLLGRGYGTGEYELYGAFTIDLNTGDMVDDPNAQPSDTR